MPAAARVLVAEGGGGGRLMRSEGPRNPDNKKAPDDAGAFELLS